MGLRLRSWLVLAALTSLGGCDDAREPPTPFPIEAAAGAPEQPAAQDSSTVDFTWSECGSLPGMSVAAKQVQFALGGEALVVTYDDGSLILHRIGQATSGLLRRAGETVAPRVSPDGQFVL